MNIIIPMAGLGKRFEEAGYSLPKPIIDVDGKPMIIRVIENIGAEDNHHIFIVQKKHCDTYDTHKILKTVRPSCDIIELNGLTEGTACTILKAEHLIDNNEELVIANSDQLVLDEDFFERGLKYFRKNKMDGGIWCFLTQEKKWSYAKLAPDQTVCRVAEKDPISNMGTVGIYYFKKGSSFVKAAKAMIDKNIRVNNEFYTCPVYNQIIESGEKVAIYMINEMMGLGTPEDLNKYLDHLAVQDS